MSSWKTHFKKLKFLAFLVLLILLVPIAFKLRKETSVSSLSSAIARDDCENDRHFIWIPEGEFISGSDRPERDYAYQISAQATAQTPESIAQAEAQLRKRRWFDGEPSRQRQFLPSFCISRNLVTNAEYQAFVEANNHRVPGISETEYQQQGFLVHPYSEVQPYLWKNGTYPANEGQHPVVLLSYEDAIAYATWKGEQDDRTYRLPTAAEWEKAARGNDGRYFPWGNQWQPDATNWSGHGAYHTMAIATYPLSRSVYGVEDMAGNVFEYTSTLQQRGLQTTTVMKGCSWDDLPGFCRGAYQHTRPIQSRHILFGFRLLREE